MMKLIRITTPNCRGLRPFNCDSALKNFGPNNRPYTDNIIIVENKKTDAIAQHKNGWSRITVARVAGNDFICDSVRACADSGAKYRKTMPSRSNIENKCIVTIM